MSFFRAILWIVFVCVMADLTAMSGVAGCTAGDPHNGKDDKSHSATAQDAVDTASAAGNLAVKAFLASFAGSGAALAMDNQADGEGAAGLIRDHLKNAFSANSITICDPAAFPVPSGGSVRITGSTGGSCNVAFSGDAASGQARANCTDFNDGDNGSRATLLGLVGVLGSSSTSGSQTAIDLTQVSSQNLSIALADTTNCTVVLNFSAQVTENADGTGSATVNGCVRVCGESYDVSGSSDF